MVVMVVMTVEGTIIAVVMVMVGGLYAVAAPAGWMLLRIAAKVGALS